MTSEAKSRFAIAGLILALISILAGSLHVFLGPIQKAPPVENFVQEKTTALKDAIIAGIKGEKPNPAPTINTTFSIDNIARASTVGLGIIALGLGFAGLIKREPMRESVSALAVASAAIVLPFAMYVVMLTLGVMVIIAIIGAIGDFSLFD